MNPSSFARDIYVMGSGLGAYPISMFTVQAIWSNGGYDNTRLLCQNTQIGVVQVYDLNG